MIDYIYISRIQLEILHEEGATRIKGDEVEELPGCEARRIAGPKPLEFETQTAEVDAAGGIVKYTGYEAACIEGGAIAGNGGVHIRENGIQ
jgi:hypothetical protein